MTKFSTTTYKLRKLWNYVKDNQINLSKKTTQEKFEFFTQLFRQQYFKTPLEIYNSGDIVVTPTVIHSSLKTIYKGKKFPIVGSYSQIIDIKIPEFFIPFVKFSYEINPLPNTELKGYVFYDTSDYIHQDLEVRADSQLIYKGTDINTLSTSPVISETEKDRLILLGVSSDSFKERWNYFFNEHYDEETEVTSYDFSGTINYIHIDIAVDGTDVDFNVNLLERGNQRIISINSTGITAIGDAIVDGVLNIDVQRSYNWDDMSWFYFSKTGGPDKNEIQDMLFLQQDYWHYWTDLKRDLFSIDLSRNRDGDFYEWVTSGFLSGYSDGMLYDNITVKRNVLSTPQIPDDVETYSDIHNHKRYISSSHNKPTFYCISPEDAIIPTYRFILSGNFIILASATERAIDRRTNENIDTQEFENKGGIWFVLINEDEDDEINGRVDRIYHKKEITGSTTEFFTDPANISSHSIVTLDATSYTAVGDETVTVYLGTGGTEITKRNNVTATKIFADATTYYIDIRDSTDFPVYDDNHTSSSPVETTLVGAIGTTSSTLVVADASRFPSSGTFRITIWNKSTHADPYYSNGEECLVTNVVGNIFTLIRFDGKRTGHVDGEAVMYYNYEENLDHTMLEMPTYIPETHDLTMRIKAHLVNPLEWREERKYTT